MKKQQGMHWKENYLTVCFVSKSKPFFISLNLKYKFKFRLKSQRFYQKKDSCESDRIETGTERLVLVINFARVVMICNLTATLLFLGVGPEHAHEDNYDYHKEEEEEVVMGEKLLTPSALQ